MDAVSGCEQCDALERQVAELRAAATSIAGSNPALPPLSLLELEVLEAEHEWYKIRISIADPDVKSYWPKYYAARERAEDAQAKLLAAREPAPAPAGTEETP